MGFQKGHKLGKGRPRGSENKTSLDIKLAFKNLVEMNLDNITEWMERVAEKNPAEALEFMVKFAQFNVPMLSRTQLTGSDGENAPVIQILLPQQTNGISKH